MLYCKHFFVWYFDSEKLLLLFDVFSVKNAFLLFLYLPIQSNTALWFVYYPLEFPTIFQKVF